uniref:Uncharacterized protein n=1 Tax=Oryza meridionalis TaxID=40149 RepID=A0A0E0EX98_9ORYZ
MAARRHGGSGFGPELGTSTAARRRADARGQKKRGGGAREMWTRKNWTNRGGSGGENPSRPRRRNPAPSSSSPSLELAGGKSAVSWEGGDEAFQAQRPPTQRGEDGA